MNQSNILQHIQQKKSGQEEIRLIDSDYIVYYEMQMEFTTE